MTENETSYQEWLTCAHSQAEAEWTHRQNVLAYEEGYRNETNCARNYGYHSDEAKIAQAATTALSRNCRESENVLTEARERFVAASINYQGTLHG